MDDEKRMMAQVAFAHLAAIGWTPRQPRTDKALGLGGEAWGGCPEGVSQRAWNERCAAAVRRMALDWATE